MDAACKNLPLLMPSSKFTSTTRLPLIYVSPIGTISIVLPHDIVIDISVDKTIRVVCFNKFALACNGKENISGIIHPKAKLFQNYEKVFAYFYSETKKKAVMGPQGVFFTMDHLKDAYLISNSFRGTSVISSNLVQFAKLDFDFTLRLFYVKAQTGVNLVELCNEIIQNAHYEEKDNMLIILINGFLIRQQKNGNVEIKCRPRNITISPSTGYVQIRTSNIDMAVESDEKAYVKRGAKRVHVSRSGMVVSDGFSTTSMDHIGQIVSTT